LLYLPDIDSWETWEHSIDRAIKSVDVALLDGTFWDAPTNSNVPHPPIRQTMDLLQDLILTGEAEVFFTHMNHNNPVLTPGSPESVELERRGYRRANEGDVIAI
jgi:pyrroloquinoline quinone biosynthesis protein B